jgi:acetyl-CoA carboxylase carboxyl transferase subunit alpha
MKITFLDFEHTLADLQKKVDELTSMKDDPSLDIDDELERLQKKISTLTETLYAKLTPNQVAKVSRHPQRPYTLDYIRGLCTDFEELHGDRHFADDKAIVGGIARFDGQAVVVLGQQKGRDTKEKLYRNFGMVRPEGYRKALRLMHLAEQFQLPILTFVDTPGAYPGIDAEERGQSEAIGKNLLDMTTLRVPIIATIIGEGGSGGALAIAVADKINMLQYATYGVISAEGAASILWKTADKANDAAQAMGITADRLTSLHLIDEVIPEPLGGAHRDHAQMMANLKTVIAAQLKALKETPVDALLTARFDKIMAYGQFDLHA